MSQWFVFGDKKGATRFDVMRVKNEAKIMVRRWMEDVDWEGHGVGGVYAGECRSPSVDCHCQMYDW